MTAIRPVVWYRLVYVACIVYLSIETAVGARGLADHHLWIGSAEAVAAAMLLFRAVRYFGLAALLVIYALVAGTTVAAGHVPAHLIIYAASAVLIVQLDRT